MTTTNTQTLPAGLAGRAAQAAAAPAPTPAPAPVAAPEPAASQPFTSLQPQDPTFNANPAPAPGPAPVNPMLSHVSQNAPAEPAPAPAPAAAPAVPDALKPVELPSDKPAETPQDASVAHLAGVFAQDVNLAPSVGYLDSFCKDNGLDVARAFGKAAEESDSRFIDEGYLTEKLGKEAAAKLIKVGVDVINYINAYTDESVAQVHKAAGGEAQWDHAAKLYSEKADPMERQIVADLLNSGDRAKMNHAAKMVTQFAIQAGGAIAHNAPALGIPGGQKGLTQAEHIANISKRGVTPEQYAESVKMRRLGKSQGL